MVASTLALLLGASGCVQSIFNKPITVSTERNAYKLIRELGPVSVERCNYIILLLIPIVRDPRDVYDDVLEQARKKGGNAVIDFQLRRTRNFFGLLYGHFCYEGRGTAAVIASE